MDKVVPVFLGITVRCFGKAIMMGCAHRSLCFFRFLSDFTADAVPRAPLPTSRDILLLITFSA